MWSSFVARRVSGEFETFREHGAQVLLGGSRRSVASERVGAHNLLPPSPYQPTTFERWLDHLMGKEAARKHAESQTQLLREAATAPERAAPASTPTFWREHGCAQSCASGVLGNACRGDELEQHWRAHLHPSARPTVSDITNGATSENSSTGRPDDTPPRGRRLFTDAQKLTIVQESEATGATVSAIARRHGIATGILFRWRAEFGVTQKKQVKLASVTPATDAAAALALQNLVRPPDGMMAIELPDGRRVFAPAGSDPVAVHERSSTAEGLHHDDRSGGREGASGAGSHRHEERSRRARHAGPGNAQAGPVLGSSVCLPGMSSIAVISREFIQRLAHCGVDDVAGLGHVLDALQYRGNLRRDGDQAGLARQKLVTDHRRNHFKRDDLAALIC